MALGYQDETGPKENPRFLKGDPLLRPFTGK